MERHRCKLCSRAFANGRALGGHMKAHLATFPLPPKTYQITESDSSSSSSSGEEPEKEEQHLQEEQEEEKGLTYGLRENPKRSFRLADPEFSFVDAGSVIQDRESETESRNPTRRRSKRNRRSFVVVTDNLQSQKLELKKKPKLTISTPPRLAESPPLAAELEPVSSVSDTSPEEDVAMCLMMLSRDVWMIRLHDHQQADQSVQVQEHSRQVVEELEGVKSKKLRGKNRCEKCNKLFRSFQAMCGHKKICFRNEEEAINNAGGEKLFECPFCYKIFGSGQALGGHKRSHLSGSSRSLVLSMAAKTEVKEGFIDLNLPAPEEDDEFSVLSDA
ncbi:zinc finger protein ZAT4-like [Pyrus ussuriensis x Pyrus communis]|uniref:Zinc finger protein ZAT4-like n=1 Tax=Pyrus ussuriensis x Pyrus communis TaxID=2448454 RepID=A0A5N5HXY6_9ROSA|nr:zinc finger protein ZAT4-like [Pyrus ussuriensis x Pyrus communis]